MAKRHQCIGNPALYQARKQIGKTVEEVAKAIDIPSATYGLCERAYFFPSKEVQVKIHRFYAAEGVDRSLEELFPEYLRQFQAPSKYVPNQRIQEQMTALLQWPYFAKTMYRPKSPFEHVVHREDSQLVDEIISKIPPKYASMVLLKFGFVDGKEYTWEEVAQKHGRCSAHVVRTEFFRVCEKLRTRFSHLFPQK